MDTLVTKLHFCIFSTEGVNKKPIRYWRGQQKTNTLLKGSTKNQYVYWRGPQKTNTCTEGVHKKPIRYCFFFLTPSVLKCIVNQKKSRFSLDNNVITVGLGQIYRWILSSFLRIKVQYWPPPSLRSGGQPILHLNSSEWRQYSPIHPPQTYRIPSMYWKYFQSCLSIYSFN